MSTKARTGRRNPFRDAASTGSSSTSQALNTAEPVYPPPPGPPPPRSSDRGPNARASSPTSQPVLSTNSIGDISRTSDDTISSSTQEEARNSQLPPPPPYSAVPNQFAGEATVEYGPLRPYQTAPPPLLIPASAPQQSTLESWGSTETLPQVAPNAQLSSSAYGSTGSVPPPRHPSQRPHRARPSNQRPEATSDSGDGSYTSASVGVPLDNSTLPSRRRNSYSSESTAQNRYTPPPPLPGRPSPPSGPLDDGKPTASPVGGHPYLNGGRILVYPTGYECYKCNNIGYKNLDPSHPCRKCWQNYGRSYSGPYLFTDWKNPPPNYQRPLPKLTPPDRPSNQTQWIANPALPNRTEPYFSSPSNSSPADTVRPLVAVRSGPPPPGALVVRPGDPRIGGKLCMYCGGEGILPGFLFIDEETCPACQGTGRVFGR